MLCKCPGSVLVDCGDVISKCEICGLPRKYDGTGDMSAYVTRWEFKDGIQIIRVEGLDNDGY